MAKHITAIDGMGAVTEPTPGSFSTTGMKTEDHMHIAYDFIIAGGVVGAGDLAVTESSPAAQSVDVAAGVAYIPNHSYASYAIDQTRYWRAINSASETIALSPNVSANPRIDLICFKVDTTATPDDNGMNVVDFFVVEGTPAASPAIPSTPDDCLAIAYVTLPAGYSSVSDSDITDVRRTVFFSAPSPVLARIHLEGTQDNIPDAPTQVLLDTVDFDNYLGWDQGNFNYVFPFDGVYQISGSVGYDGIVSGDRVRLLFRFNGATDEINSSSYATGTDRITVSGLTRYAASAGEYVSLWTRGAAAGGNDILNDSASTFLEVQFVSPLMLIPDE